MQKGKSRDTWSNRQVWPLSTKGSRAMAKRVLPREHTGHSQHPLPTTQETTPDGQYWNQTDYILCSWRWRIYSQQKQDLELAVAQIMSSLLQNSDLNWRKYGKPVAHSGRPKSNLLWSYSGTDKQIQGIRSDRVTEELWTEVHNIVQEAVIKTIPKKKKCKKANGCLRRPYE